jgi:hypothetical protein
MNVMNAVSHNYKPADLISPAEISAGVESFFNGDDLLAKIQAIPLSTVDADGWSKVRAKSCFDMMKAFASAFFNNPIPQLT